jgi:hypothetical protein
MKELSKQQKVVTLKNGIRYTIDADRADTLNEQWKAGGKGVAEIDGESFSLDSISGINYPDTVKDMVNEKQGREKCRYGKYHSRGQQCDCGSGGSSLPLYHWEGGAKYIDGKMQMDSTVDYSKDFEGVFARSPHAGKEQMIQGLQKFLDANPNSPSAFALLVKLEKSLENSKSVA